MLEQAVMDEGLRHCPRRVVSRAAVCLSQGAAGSTSFADYEQPASQQMQEEGERVVGVSSLRLTKRLAYLEAGSTNTECWVVNS